MEVRAVLSEAAGESADWVEIADLHPSATEVVLDGRRFVVVDSPARHRRDDARHDELMARTKNRLIALAGRVRAGRLSDPMKIGAAADRILRDSGVGRCFVIQITGDHFDWGYDEEALSYVEDLLIGRYVLSTSLSEDQASTIDTVRHCRVLQHVERRFRVLKDFPGLRPVNDWTEKRVRGHITICVVAAMIETVMAKDLARAGRAESRPQPPGARRAARTYRARPHPDDDDRRRRAPRNGRHEAVRPSGSEPQGLRRRHLELGPGRNHLSSTNAQRVVETLSARTTAELRRREHPLQAGAVPTRKHAMKATRLLGSSFSRHAAVRPIAYDDKETVPNRDSVNS